MSSVFVTYNILHAVQFKIYFYVYIMFRCQTKQYGFSLSNNCPACLQIASKSIEFVYFQAVSPHCDET